MFTVVSMSKTVSARIAMELHEELVERCNRVGCTIADFIQAAIEFAMYGNTEFDFGDEESETVDNAKKDELDSSKSNNNHEGKKPVIHLYWENGKLVQGETTWEETSKN